MQAGCLTGEMVALGLAQCDHGGCCVQLLSQRTIACPFVEMGPHCCVPWDRSRHPLDRRKARQRSVDLTDDDSPVQFDDRGGGKAHEFVVPLEDLGPVRFL